MRALVIGSLLLLACEGQVGELGQTGAPTDPVAVIRDRSGPEVVSFSCSASSVVTRESFSCTAEAKHPTNQVLSCAIDVGDGRLPIELGDCSTLKNATVLYTSPGNPRLTLQVSDAQERTASRSVTMTVTGLPNQPPEVIGLTASKMSGVAPLQTTLSWSSTDPEGDEVTCALDVGADGSIEHEGVDCNTWNLALRTVGTVPVKVIATDSGGLASDRTVTITVAPPTADIRIDSIEFGQTVMKSGLKLVGDKPALLRVIVLANEANLSTVVEVEAKVGSSVLGKERLMGPATVPLLHVPGDLSRSFRFMMPRTWLVPGVSLSIKVDPSDDVMEADETNNAQTIDPMLGRDNVLHLTGVPVVMGTQTGVPLDLDDTVTSIWPVKSVDQKSRAPYTFTGSLSSTDTSGWGQLLGEIAQVAGMDGSSRAYYGFIPGGGGGIAGLGYVGQHVAIGLDGYASVAAHELGHNFGINHAPCGGAAGADSNYPYPGAQIGSWGFNGSQLIEPTRFVDIMSYCNPTWVSDYNYEKAQQHMEFGSTFDPDATLPAITPEDSVLISGKLSAGGATIDPVYRVRAAPTASVDSEIQLKLVTLDGRELVVPVTIMRPAEGDEVHFFSVIRWPGELARVSLVRGGTVLGVRESKAPSPSVEGVQLQRVDAKTIRVVWSGGATATIAHLGEERTTVTIGASGGSVLVRTDGLEGGVIEVSLSNGLRTVRREFP